jgi:hypothetical protein
MKYLLIILLFISFELTAQNTIYLTWQPVDMGLGIRYDRQFKEVGLYTSLSKGEYQFDEGYIKDHWKAALGGIAYIKDAFLSAGFNLHSYGENSGVNPDVLYPISFEVGLGLRLSPEKWSVALRLDPVKWDSSIDVGLRF